MKDFSRLMRRMGYQFQNPALLKQALTHRSHKGVDNERLEFLGDSIVNFIIAQELYERFPRADEGELSRFRAMLVKGDTLAEMAQELQLGDELQLGGGELKSGGFRRASILADAFEALVGAIYLDSTMLQCHALIRQWFEVRLEQIAKTAKNKDPKTALQELLQSKKLPLPQYELVSAIGVEHQQVFLVDCSVQGSPTVTRGQASSRRKAEQIAATKLLAVLSNDT